MEPAQKPPRPAGKNGRMLQRRWEAKVGEPNNDAALASSPRHELTGGPGQPAVDCLARIVAAIELTPMVAVHSVERDGVVRFWNRASAEQRRRPMPRRWTQRPRWRWCAPSSCRRTAGA